MTTGATGQLGLALPVQGELSGTWGDTVNNGITQYTNIAIAATLTLTNDGAVTLANTTGDASASNITSSLTGAGTVTAQFAIVRVTGTLTTAKVITAPSYSKTYVVVNAATGGIVTFKASGQTGVSIAVGESAWVYYNGTDYVKIVGTATAGAAGGSNTQVQFNSSGSLAGDADLTFDGTTLSTAGLTASGTVTLSGGTANGVTYLNGSKVLTSGSALTFDGTTLGVNTGVSNSTSMLITGAYTGGGTATMLAFQRAGGAVAGAIKYSDVTGAIEFGTTTNHTLLFLQNNTEGMRLTSTGLGIGTSSPAAKLDVSGFGRFNFNASGTYIRVGAVSDASADIYKPVGNIGYTVESAYAHTWYTGGTERMRLDSAGNLGLGTSSPTAYTSRFIEVSNATSAGIKLTATSGNALGAAVEFVASDKSLRIGTYESTGFIRFGTQDTERARIDASGNVLIGGTAARGTTVGAAHLDLFNGTAPAGTLTNGVSLYSSSGDLKFMNAAGDAFDVGYRNIPQNVQTGSYTLTLADAGDHIYRGSGGAATWTIPAASSVAYPLGTAITFINLSATAVSIAITTDTMYLSSAGTTGTRTLAQYGSATAIKVSGVSSSGIWVISGSGLT